MSLAIGVDVGGTKIAAALVETATGALEAHAVEATRPERGPQAVLDDCVALAATVAGRRRGLPIGIGVCELVDPAGRVRSAETVDWRDVDVAEALGPLGPARVSSDIRAQAIAESLLGAARGHRSALVVTVSTGISHCFVLDGWPWEGARGNAICTGAPLVEATSSGRALALAGGRASAAEVLADPACADLVAAAADLLGHELARLVNALDPHALVIAGGLGLVDAYREQVTRAMRPRIYSPETAALPVLPAELGADAGVVGAALLAPGVVR